MTRRHVHLHELVEDVRHLVVLIIIGLVPATALGIALWKYLDVTERDGVLGGLLTFLILEGLVLYEVIARTGDDVRSLTSAQAPTCRILPGPPHAKLRLHDDGWRGDGITWLGLNSEPDSQIVIRLTVPPGVDIRPISRESYSAVWRRMGPDPLGVVTWEITLDRVQAFTPIGQFEVSAEKGFEPEGRGLVLEASGHTARQEALSDRVTVALLQDIPLGVEFQNV